jgi:hypothetical protein
MKDNITLQEIEYDFIKYKVLLLKLQNKSLKEVLKDKELVNIDKEVIKNIYIESDKVLVKDSEILNTFTKTRELLKTELIEKEAWEAYNSSKEGNIQEVLKEGVEGIETVIKKSNNSHNIKALEVILDCIKERNRMLGNIAPIKAEHSGAIELRDIKINYVVPEGDE